MGTMFNNLFQYQLNMQSTLDVDIIDLISNFHNMLCPLQIENLKKIINKLMTIKVINSDDKTTDEWIDEFLTKYPHVNLRMFGVKDKKFDDNGFPTKIAFIESLRNHSAIHRYNESNVFIFEEIIIKTIPNNVPGEISHPDCITAILIFNGNGEIMTPTLIFPAYARYQYEFSECIYNVAYSLDGLLDEESLRTVIFEFSVAATQLRPMHIDDDDNDEVSVEVGSAGDSEDDDTPDDFRYMLLLPQSVNASMFNISTLKFTESAKLDILICPDSFKTGQADRNIVVELFRKEFEIHTNRVLKKKGSLEFEDIKKLFTKTFKFIMTPNNANTYFQDCDLLKIITAGVDNALYYVKNQRKLLKKINTGYANLPL